MLLLLKSMSKNNNEIQNHNNNSTLIHRQSVSFSGPLPHPEILKKFDDVYPGAAKIIIEMAKDQSEHRQELEKSVIASDIKNSKLGLYFGFIIGMAGMIAGTIVIIIGQVIAGSFISGATLIGLVGTFVYGSRGRRKEREQKRDE